MIRTTALAAALLAATSAPAADPPGRVGGKPVAPAGQALPDPVAANVVVAGAVVEPIALKPDVASLKVPDGFAISVFADGLGNARLLAVADDGTVYLTRRTEGDVVMLRDADGDGRAEMRKVVAQRPGMHGIAIDGRTAYMVTVKDVYTAPILADGSFGALTRIVDDLPDRGQHGTRTVSLGPDGMLYLTVGSTCNACEESSPESATILRMRKDGKSRAIFASGLRDTIGFDWDPRTGALWGMDHGIDWLGDEQQPEELNRIQPGKRYGWPYIYGFGGQNPQDDPPGEISMATWDAMSQRPVAGYAAHAAPMQLKFYRAGAFPQTWQGDAYVTMRGSWNRSMPVGYEVVRLHLAADGSASFAPFVTGFLRALPNGGWGQSGRPVGLAVAKDGALLFTDDVNGVIYRVAATRPANVAALPPAPNILTNPLDRPKGIALAAARPETAATGRLTVSAPFAGGRPIARTYSAYYENVSPPIAWSGAPAATAAYALLVEDPDATSDKPVVHWAAYNIPPTTTKLEEGVPNGPQIKPRGFLRQGLTSNGRDGWTGPRPPVGDPAHHYHVQVFALDRMLDLDPGASREALLAAMQGHVLAKGETVGTYAQAAPPTK